MTDTSAVILPVGADLYAVPMMWMREVLATPPVTEVVTAQPVVLGLINLRGEIVILLDTAFLLGVGSMQEPPYAVVLNTAYGPVALAASGLPERVVLDAPTGPSELPGTAGVYLVGDRIAALLDPAILLSVNHLGDSSTLIGVG